VAARVQDAFRSLAATTFYLFASATLDVAIYGREHVSGQHPTIFLANHKSDLDSLTLVSVAYFAQGLTQPDQRIVYALREDAYWPGFLAYLSLPGALGALSRKLHIAPHLRLLKAYPMGYLTGRKHLPRIQAQLNHFSSLIDRGRDLYWTPEGGLGQDGHLEPFRAGFYRIVAGSRADVRIVPMAVVYDFMTSGRTRCFVRLGPELAVDRSLGRKAVEQQARLGILRQLTLDAGHLAAAVLRELPPGAGPRLEDFESSFIAHARRYRRLGVALDPRLTMRWTLPRRLRQLHAYAHEQGIWDVQAGRVLVRQGLDHPRMRYVLNELLDIEEGLVTHG
jgi:1-acyl-sn-glycerol-3-phosphate acyltransferase